MKTNAESLYRNYSNKSHRMDGIQARMKQRSYWWKQYRETGKCKKKLELIGAFEDE